MIQITNIETYGWETAVRGMRNPMNSWKRSDSVGCIIGPNHPSCVGCPGKDNVELCKKITLPPYVGPNDLSLMLKLAKAGSDHAKYRRMITVTMDILAPLYWWKEFDTYKVGTVANSCSSMHNIIEKEFTLDDFSHEHLMDGNEAFAFPLGGGWRGLTAVEILNKCIIEALNNARKRYLSTADKKYWWQIIQLLPSSYNQLRTIQLNYEVLTTIYHARRNHKLDEWVEFCKTIETLPYSEIITLKEV